MNLECCFQDNNIAKDFNIGKTRIKICTDYCVKSSDESKKTLRDIAKKVHANLNGSTLEKD